MWLDKFSARVFSWNREGQYLLFYLLTVCCFMFPIEYLHIGLKYSTIFDLRILLPQGKPVGDTLSAFAPTVADAFLLSLPLFFCTNRRWVVFIPLFLFDVFCLIQTLYARVYEDIMPYSSFLLVNNVNDVLLIAALYMCRSDRKAQTAAIVLWCCAYYRFVAVQLFYASFITALLIQFYNGKRGGPKHGNSLIKWGFYVIYPAHLLVLGLANILF